MSNLKFLNKLAGQKLKEISLIKEFFDDKTKPMNVALLLKFKEFNCLIYAISNDDTILVKLKKNLKWIKKTGKYKAFDISNSKFWKDCIGRHVVWAWQLINHQGYEDGLQFYLSNDLNKQEIIRQIVVKASQLYFYKV
ncbi:hypothetical protein A2526_05850 [candidate division WOR-1 bacterium RIFOXYD2_FULL_36_8]|uniref:Uncharacterized protein n=1 Tax=candidate division WOR-1 bacterium RIFOXYB2_FULL_36_35 TaxID=1802578 RepID=A0A1F4S1R7_UNCSA|nr:MAG: hypothetical protein A2230_05275 [candidate division WOR-1 bacterium RIFOXYA2_FULL_36_21]OGC14337.1 MAG: hypothetical protein A2290_08355 [candidate division WOR-1 bacterium RIFOXYB2_FULL_36_35]OGC19633.1 MAG: hypothetical protein A2282_02730 [candidate division WOR-1 bacterium RIFOXYA12_FULL_36_13]OGC41538.1 MAG: hypothetical protein A2526_05850 [candidate division WOR-1 bacterium RIFOXYD2_FULL_36_8]